MEDDRTFEDVHALILRLVAEGLVDACASIISTG
jgi:maltooligosyltrehalose synthase